VKKDPRLDTPMTAYQEQDDFLKGVANEISAIHEGVIRLRGVREQVRAYLDRTKEREDSAAIQETGKALVEKLDAMEDELVQKRTVDGQTVINFEVQLNHHFIILHGAVDGSEEGVIEGARDRLSDLMGQWNEKRATLGALLGAELEAFNTLVREKAIPAVVPPGAP
jgi:phosphoenolpyruvate-protein kinase (PTS system EI component)